MLTPADYIFNLKDSDSSSFYFESISQERNQLRYCEDANYSDPIATYKYSPSFSPRYIENNLSCIQFEEIFNLINDNEKLLSMENRDLTPYFPGVRYLSEGIVVFERPPEHRLIGFYSNHRDNLDESTKYQQHVVPLPWQVYVACYNPADMRLISVAMYFSKTSLYSFDQIIYAPPIFNFYSDGTLCRPFYPSIEDVTKYQTNVNGIIASAYDWVWNSSFNYDIVENICYFIKKGLATQFEPYTSQTAFMQSLNNYQNYISSNFRTSHNSIYEVFFHVWSSISIEDILNIEWPPFIENKFYSEVYQDSSSYIEMWAEEQGYAIHENYRSYEEHDEDCEEGCIYLDDVYSSVDFNNYLFERSGEFAHQHRTLHDALMNAFSIIKNNRLGQRVDTLSKYNSSINSNLLEYFSSSE